jgi:hypothetical protein
MFIDFSQKVEFFEEKLSVANNSDTYTQAVKKKVQNPIVLLKPKKD